MGNDARGGRNDWDVKERDPICSGVKSILRNLTPCSVLTSKAKAENHMRQLTAAILVTLFLQSCAFAQRGTDRDRWSFFAERYDKNSDGSITAEEYGRNKETFKRLDTNGDGKLTTADFASSGRRRGGSPRRMRGRIVTRLLDRDRSGDVSAEEWKSFVMRLPSEGAINREDWGVPARMAGRVTTLFDVDADGKATRKEVASVLSDMDANQDAALSASELAGAIAAPRAGEKAPEFDLPLLEDTRKSVKLSSYSGKKPVALIFGSYT